METSLGLNELLARFRTVERKTGKNKEQNKVVSHKSVYLFCVILPGAKAILLEGAILTDHAKAWFFC